MIIDREKLIEDMAQAMYDDYPHPMRQEPWDETTDVGKIYWRRKAAAAFKVVEAAIQCKT